MISRQQLIDVYRQACEAELQAFKPGNVSVYSAGHDMEVEDFRISFRVSSGPITNPAYTLGEKIYYAVKQTRDAVGCNTNLGIILLCAPLLQVAASLTQGQSLRNKLSNLLASTTRQDADWVFKAITLAAPGGLGDSDEADVKQEASVTLTEAMEIASSKDRIAYQYISNYKDIFDFTVLLYNNNFAKFGDQNWAALAVYAGMLTRHADSHIERKYGPRYSAWVASEMEKVHQALLTTRHPESLVSMLEGIDAGFKEKGINPGTTADITVATVLVVLLEQLINGASVDRATRN
ncbi:triphosphoribosyl-dephospho-CoA synthase [Methylomarinum sp. Ch1-1]|uniref:Triphosphoribosyl-dephospho-CoA synthase n=1 Tax=Methylomarinum roseum TaxID=3067653 RepID=A0AAU7NSP2_9GAMM|nr:triphosphoribosyl-dephospho-CoA synthase [Methylomarinum sp. Ch1-1]MDP4520351.1 triphosphoribosyl-dephospho-CoA synthase [Methylomarinum sp. Ch1-1]